MDPQLGLTGERWHQQRYVWVEEACRVQRSVMTHTWPWSCRVSKTCTDKLAISILDLFMGLDIYVLLIDETLNEVYIRVFILCSCFVLFIYFKYCDLINRNQVPSVLCN